MKRNLKQLPVETVDKDSLSYPKDKFDLISIDSVEEWDAINTAGVKSDGTLKHKTVHMHAVYITLKCKKCGSIKKHVRDTRLISCKIGPCNVKWVDLTGKKFGDLTVLEPVLTKVSSRERVPHWRWRCVCSCGRECLKTEHDLVTLHYSRCHFCGLKSMADKNTLPNDMSKWNRMIRYYKKNAATYGREFSLSKEDFIKIATSNCAYCGAPPRKTGYGVVCNGIDREDNLIGYTLSNSVACCTRCNIMKGNMSKNSFFEHISKIASNCGVRFNDYPEREYAQAGGNEELPFKSGR